MSVKKMQIAIIDFDFGIQYSFLAKFVAQIPIIEGLKFFVYNWKLA